MEVHAWITRLKQLVEKDYTAVVGPMGTPQVDTTQRCFFFEKLDASLLVRGDDFVVLGDTTAVVICTGC